MYPTYGKLRSTFQPLCNQSSEVDVGVYESVLETLLQAMCLSAEFYEYLSTTAGVLFFFK